jgi:hypothetical protein
MRRRVFEGGSNLGRAWVAGAFAAGLFLVPLPSPASAGELAVAFADPAWTGERVPEGQQCSRYGGHGKTPALRVSGIPVGADAIILEFNDETYKPMDRGGHGIIGFRIALREAVLLPSVAGETNELPEGVFVVAPHLANKPGYSPGTAYLPPCSGGKGNTYTATVKAVRTHAGGRRETLAAIRLVLGTY